MKKKYIQVKDYSTTINNSKFKEILKNWIQLSQKECNDISFQLYSSSNIVIDDSTLTEQEQSIFNRTSNYSNYDTNKTGVDNELILDKNTTLLLLNSSITIVNYLLSLK